MDYFNLKFHNTTVKNEIYAGIALFMAMSYILIVCPTVLSGTGMNYTGVFFATICVSAFTTIISGILSKLPIAMAPGIGICGIFYTLATGDKGIPWQLLLLATYFSGIVICIFVRFGIFELIMDIMDEGFRRMIMSGVGLALLLYGISTIGLLEKENGVYRVGQLQIVPLGICIISLGVIFLLKKKNKKSFILVGLLVAYILSIFTNFSTYHRETGEGISKYLKSIFRISYNFDDMGSVMFCFPDLVELIQDKEMVFLLIYAIFIFTMGHFFDAVGTNMAAFDAINENIDERMKDTVSLKKVIIADGIGNIASGILGTSSVTSFGESSIGIICGGKTGITAITTGCLFLLCLFFSPLFTSIDTCVAAPALIYVGGTLLLRYREFDRNRWILFLFGIGLIGYIGMTFNIGNAVLYGLIVYVWIKKNIEKKDISKSRYIMYAFAMIHCVLNFII